MFSHRARPLEAPSEVDAFECGQPGTTVDQEAESGKASPGGRGLNTVVCVFTLVPSSPGVVGVQSPGWRPSHICQCLI